MGSLTLHVMAIICVISVIAAAAGIAHITLYVYWTKECAILLVTTVVSACHVVTLSSCSYSNNVSGACVSVLFGFPDGVASEAGSVSKLEVSKQSG